MTRPRLPVTHCRGCGGPLGVRNLRQVRARGLFGPKQWQAEMVCPQ